jgi:GT2 family glycosyltransferase
MYGGSTLTENLHMIETTDVDPTPEIFKLLAIVVLYKLKPCESAAFKSLQTAIVHDQGRAAQITILLYDNTPGGQQCGALPADVLFKADTGNGGLAKAYNYALEVALENGFEWLLTLDQDTRLPLDFVCRLADLVALATPRKDLAAIVPRLSSDGRAVSPGRLLKPWGHVAPFPDAFTGISLDETIAMNSASTFRVSALKSIGGYDPRFQIWCSDVVIYHRIHSNNFRVLVATDIQVEHEMAGLDLKLRSNPKRYEDALRAEEAFYDEYMGWVSDLVLRLKILRRLVYGIRAAGGTLPYYMIGLKYLCRRLFYSRRRRRESWRRFVTQSSPGCGAATDTSALMALYDKDSPDFLRQKLRQYRSSDVSGG